MSQLFKKLNLKAETEILVVNGPASFEPELAALSGVRVQRDPAQVAQVSFALAFVTTQAERDALGRVLSAKAAGDALLWFVYPKQSSKRYRCEFNRDSGWAVLAAAGFESVRMVAIDEDWSALRFRRAEYVKASARTAPVQK